MSMQNQTNTKAMVEAGIFTAVAVVLILMCYFIPGFMIVGVFVWPIPITLIYVRHGAKYSILSFVATLIITMMTTDPLTAIGIVTIYGLMGLVLGYCIKNKKGVSGSILLLTCTVFIASLSVFQLLSAVTGQNFIDNGIQMLNQGFEASKNIYASMGVDQATQEKMAKMIPSAEIIRMIIPAAFLAYSVTAAFLCYLITQKVLRKFRYEIAAFSPVSEWYIPSKASFLIIIIFGAAFLLMYSGIENGQRYFVNAYLIFNYAFSVNAVAFLSWFLKKRGMGRVLRVVVILLCILPPIGSYLYLIGVFDYIFDFRKLDPIRKRLEK